MNKIKVFISYADEDRQVAHELKTIFEQVYGFYVFAFKKSLRLSQPTAETIISNLKNCDFFVPIISKNYEKSPTSNQEAGIALSLGKKIIPPVIDEIGSPCGFLSIYWGGLEVTEKRYIAENIASLFFFNIFEADQFKNFRLKARSCVVDALCISQDFKHSTLSMRAIMKVEGLLKSHKEKIIAAVKENRCLYEEQFTFPTFRTYFRKKFNIDF